MRRCGSMCGGQKSRSLPIAGAPRMAGAATREGVACLTDPYVGMAIRLLQPCFPQTFRRERCGCANALTAVFRLAPASFGGSISRYRTAVWRPDKIRLVRRMSSRSTLDYRVMCGNGFRAGRKPHAVFSCLTIRRTVFATHGRPGITALTGIY